MQTLKINLYDFKELDSTARRIAVIDFRVNNEALRYKTDTQVLLIMDKLKLLFTKAGKEVTWLRNLER